MPSLASSSIIACFFSASLHRVRKSLREENSLQGFSWCILQRFGNEFPLASKYCTRSAATYLNIGNKIPFDLAFNAVGHSPLTPELSASLLCRIVAGPHQPGHQAYRRIFKSLGRIDNHWTPSKAGSAKSSVAFLKIHNSEEKFIVIFVKYGCHTNSLLNSVHRLYALIEHNKFAGLSINACGHQLGGCHNHRYLIQER